MVAANAARRSRDHVAQGPWCGDRAAVGATVAGCCVVAVVVGVARAGLASSPRGWWASALRGRRDVLERLGRLVDSGSACEVGRLSALCSFSALFRRGPTTHPSPFFPGWELLGDVPVDAISRATAGCGHLLRAVHGAAVVEVTGLYCTQPQPGPRSGTDRKMPPGSSRVRHSSRSMISSSAHLCRCCTRPPRTSASKALFVSSPLAYWAGARLALSNTTHRATAGRSRHASLPQRRRGWMTVLSCIFDHSSGVTVVAFWL